ncbi:condensation domain-containing protein, partial [Achromobacter xylosoxidans]
EDLQAAYQAARAGRRAVLPARTASYGAWTRYVADLARTMPDPERAWWHAQEARAAGFALPLDDARSPATVVQRASVAVTLDEPQTLALLRQAPAAYRTLVNDLLLTALARALGEGEVRIDVEGHGREAEPGAPDVSRTVGWFTTLYPVVLDASGEPGAALKRVKEALRAVPRRGLGHGALRAGRPLASSPVLFNYLGQFDGSFGDGAQWRPALEPAGAALDPAAPLWHELAVDGQVYQGRLTLTLSYSRARLSAARVQAWADAYRDELLMLLDHCARAPRGVTPSDFPLARLAQPQLDALALPWAQVEDLYGVSPMQAGMLFHSRVEQETGVYVTQLRVALYGLDPARLREAWRAAVARHDALRSGFIDVAGAAPVQWVVREVDLPWRELDWRGHADAAGALEALAREELGAPFDLAAPPLMRWALVRNGDTDYTLLWTNHHLLLDGWSTSRLLGEVLRAYHGAAVEPPAARYRDYLAWLAARDAAAAEQWWRATLAGLDEPSLLAADLPPSGLMGHGEILLRHDAARTGTLLLCARRQRVTPNTLVQAAWARVLQTRLGQDCVAFGATSSGRPADLIGAQTLLGLFINTVPMIVPARPAMAVGDWLRALQAQGVAAREFEHTPLYDIQRWAGHGGRALFDTLVVFENYPIDAALREADSDGLRIGAVHNSDPTHYPWTLEAAVREEDGVPSFGVRCLYRRDRLGREAAQALADAFDRVLWAMVADPDQPVGQLDALADADRRSLVARGQGGMARPAMSVPQRLAAQALATP